MCGGGGGGARALLTVPDENENKGEDDANLPGLSLHCVHDIFYRVLEVSEKSCILCDITSACRT